MKKNITLIMTALILNAFFAFPLTSSAQAPGSLDLTFDTDGKVTTAIGTSNDEGRSVAIQSDGKIVVAGQSYNGTNYDFAVVRYNANGSLDNTFDTDGKVTTAIGTGNDAGRSVAIQSDGKIVVVGSSVNGSYANYAVVRYNTNGSLDNTFDTDGKVTTAVGAYGDEGYGIVIQNDSKIVVAGTSSTGAAEAFSLIRYNANGSLDNTFDTDGKVTTPTGFNSNLYGRALAIQSDGKILVAGFMQDLSIFDFALIRYNTNGSLDITFDTDGIVTTDIGNFWEEGHSIAIQSDGKILVAGESENAFNYEFALVRYNTNGSLDNSFDTDGIVTTSVGSGDDEAYDLAIQSDGKILVVGGSSNGSNYDFGLARYNINGSLDNTFDTDGKVTTSIGTAFDHAYSVAIQSDGKIVVAGQSQNGANFNIALARYNNTSTIGINETDNQSTEIKVYPNPTCNNLTIEFGQAAKNFNVKIISLTGQILFENFYQSSSKIDIDTKQLASGMYMAYLKDDESSTYIKFIKE